jgi:hypothetical protein
MDGESIYVRSDHTFTYCHSSDYGIATSISGTWRRTGGGRFVTQLPLQDGQQVSGGLSNLEWRIVVGGIVPRNGGGTFSARGKSGLV